MENNEKELDARGVLAELISYREEMSQVEENEKRKEPNWGQVLRFVF